MYALLTAYGVINHQGLGLNCEITWLEETKTRIIERLRSEIEVARKEGFVIRHRLNDMAQLSKPDNTESVLFMVEELGY